MRVTALTTRITVASVIEWCHSYVCIFSVKVLWNNWPVRAEVWKTSWRLGVFCFHNLTSYRPRCFSIAVIPNQYSLLSFGNECSCFFSSFFLSFFFFFLNTLRISLPQSGAFDTIANTKTSVFLSGAVVVYTLCVISFCQHRLALILRGPSPWPFSFMTAFHLVSACHRRAGSALFG